jgi:hypothetical protein
MEELLKEPKLWGLGSLTNSFGFFRSTNRSFDFLKIVGHGSILPRPYLPMFSSKRREDKTNVFFWQMFFFSLPKWQKFSEHPYRLTWPTVNK